MHHTNKEKRKNLLSSHVAEYNEQRKYECYMLESNHQHKQRTVWERRTEP